MSGSFVPVHVDHWQGGAVVSASEFRAAGRRSCSDQPIHSASAGAGHAELQNQKPNHRQARLGAFWSCYTLGFFIRLPLVLWAGIRGAIQRLSIFVRTYHRRLDLLDGKLRILFLNGFLPNAVSLLFGELFTTVLTTGVAVDPGSPKMRGSLERHLCQIKPKITKVVATHAHEEHVGNLNWLSDLTGAPIYVSEMTARFLTPFKKLPWVRATIIGQPPNLKEPHQLLRGLLDLVPGNCR